MSFLLKNKYLLFILLLSAALAPYIYLSAFANPVADDLLYAHKAQATGLIDGIVSDYYHWNGRYFSNALVVLDPMACNSLAGYKIAPVVIILLTIISIYVFVRVITGSLLSRAASFTITLLLTLVYLFKMPTLAEGIYWFTGAVTYQVGIIFALWYFTALISFIQRRFLLNSKMIHLVILTVLLIVSIGFNEVQMLLLLGVSLLQFIIAARKKSEHRKLSACLLILALICSSIMILAPGNAERASTYTANDNLNITSSLLFSVIQTIRFFFDWISSLPLIIASFFYYFLNRRLSGSIVLFRESFGLTPALSTSLLFLIIYACIFPAYWGTGILGQHRTLNTAYFFFITCWFINLTVIFNRFLFKKESYTITASLEIILGLLLFFSIAATGNGYSAATDIIYGKAKRYNSEMNERLRLIKEQSASTSDSILVPPLQAHPSTLFVLDITHDPGHWINRSYAIYYNTNQKIVRYPAFICE